MATKLQITITSQEENALAQKAALLGYDVTKYVKFMISKETYEQKKENLRLGKLLGKALEEHKQGKTTVLDSIDEIDEI